jgi:hypothetical protein
MRKKNQALRLILIISISLLVTGCGSNEISPQEKRNNYDACIGKYFAKYGYNQPEAYAKGACSGFLE